MSQTEHTLSARHAFTRVPGIAQVDGWTLHSDATPGVIGPVEHYAVRDDEFVDLGVSRWDFDPTQERWDWLVRNDFPARLRRASGVSTPICNSDIDAALARQVAA